MLLLDSNLFGLDVFYNSIEYAVKRVIPKLQQNVAFYHKNVRRDML